MEHKGNQTNMMQAVLMDEHLMKIGEYSLSDIPDNIYIARDSNNYVIHTVATIISRHANGDIENDIYKQVNQYLQGAL